MKPICEICHESIEEAKCIDLSPFEHKFCHLSCFRKRITDAFSDVIGTQDDMIDELYERGAYTFDVDPEAVYARANEIIARIRKAEGR